MKFLAMLAVLSLLGCSSVAAPHMYPSDTSRTSQVATHGTLQGAAAPLPYPGYTVKCDPQTGKCTQHWESACAYCSSSNIAPSYFLWCRLFENKQVHFECDAACTIFGKCGR